MLPHDRLGDGPPLLLVHYVGGTRAIWAPVRERLAREFDVVALDLPGFGDAPEVRGEATLPALADAVAETTRELGFERPRIAGISLGGGVALELARRGAVHSATVISPVGFTTRREELWLRGSLLGVLYGARALTPALPALTRAAPLRALLGAQAYARPSRVPRDALLRATLDAAAAPGMRPAIDHAVGWRLEDPIAPEVPVTILWGARDRLLWPRQGRRATRAIPHAQLVPLPGCGHIPFYDDPPLVERALLQGVRR